MRLALVTDLHYRGAVPGTSRLAKRESRRALDLLDQVIARCGAARVDLLVCAGDCVDTHDDPNVFRDLETLRDHFAAAPFPTIVIPGNHDPVPDAFYRVLPRPPRIARFGSRGEVEVITFYDDHVEEGVQQSSRRPELLAFMREHLAANPPDVLHTVCIQHFVVHPPHTGTGYAHPYANDAEIRAVLETSPRRLLVLSGHNHAGHALSVHNGVTYLTAQALCERPYFYYLIDLNGPTSSVQQLALEDATASS
jgi:DNA repair exonuclease SbcCD nuclease subunit